jgi:DNA-binding CsgD family transcriptional regulator
VAGSQPSPSSSGGPPSRSLCAPSLSAREELKCPASVRLGITVGGELVLNKQGREGVARSDRFVGIDLDRELEGVALVRQHPLLDGGFVRESGRLALPVSTSIGPSTLRSCHETFTDMLAAIGMEAFADRARNELAASGERVRRRSVETRDDLTAEARQVAQLARDGLSNPEAGARLFLSPRTVEWHLRKVFFKLGIRCRRELVGALSRCESDAVPA